LKNDIKSSFKSIENRIQAIEKINNKDFNLQSLRELVALKLSPRLESLESFKIRIDSFSLNEKL
jgi:hypothetical protein